MKYVLIFLVLFLSNCLCLAQTDTACKFTDEQAVVVNGASGFKIDKYIVTASHVVRKKIPYLDVAFNIIRTVTVDLDSVQIIELSGDTSIGIVVARDTINDIALIKVPLSKYYNYSTALPTIYQRVFSISNPGGYIFSHVSGEVQFIDRILDDDTRKRKHIQVGIDVYFGSSGSPVFTSDGKILGMMIMATPGTRFAFCVPIEKIVTLIEKQNQLEQQR